jgi:hypothetical protein
MKNKLQFKMKRKLWISPDTNTQFKIMFNLIKYLESLPIKKYTMKQFDYNKYYNKYNNNNKTKLTKKIIY